MITKQDLLPLIKKNNLFKCEVDDRHMEIINDIFSVGFTLGIEHAKKCVEWRINGDVWAKFIDEDITAEYFPEQGDNDGC